jgi:hypothetical protein
VLQHGPVLCVRHLVHGGQGAGVPLLQQALPGRGRLFGVCRSPVVLVFLFVFVFVFFFFVVVLVLVLLLVLLLLLGVSGPRCSVQLV